MAFTGGQKISRSEWARIRAMAERARAAEPKPPEPPPRKPWIFGYRRCSHEDSAKSGLGLDEQSDRIEAYTGLLLVDHPDCEVGPQYDDLAVSAFKVPFRRRKDASKMLEKMWPGDHVVFAEFTRAFRNAKDALTTLDYLKKRGIHVHFADLRVDLESPAGELLITVMAAVAQWYARDISERNKAVARRLKAERGRAGGVPPMGTRWAGPRGKRYLADSPADREVMARIVEMHEGPEQMTWCAISDRLEEQLATEEHRAPRPVGFGRKWGPRRCQRAHRVELELRAKEAKEAAVAKKQPE